MRSQLKLIEKQYQIAVAKWDDKMYKKQCNHGKCMYHKDTTSYQITPFNYLFDIIKTLYKKFGIKPYQFKNMSLVDLGCGYGGLLKIVGPYFKNVRGVEYNPLFVEYGKEIFNGKVNLQQGNVSDIVCTEDIIYTFNITYDKSIFLPILRNMRPGQIFIESWGEDPIIEYAKELKFSKIELMSWWHGIIIQK